MKRLFYFIACIAISFVALVSCRNTRTEAPSHEEIQHQKQEVADSLSNQIDAFADMLFDAASKTFRMNHLELSEAEKLVKPDYLLDPSEAGHFVTRLQKINALAYYIVESGVRMAYDMPVDEAKEAIAKLATELGYPIDFEYMDSDAPFSEKIRRKYVKCKEQGDVSLFWKFQCALVFHTDYIVASNPDLYIPKISEDGLQQFNLVLEYINNAATALAPYDAEMAALLKEIKEWDLLLEQSDWDEAFASGSSTAQFYTGNKSAIIERRNRMIYTK